MILKEGLLSTLMYTALSLSLLHSGLVSLPSPQMQQQELAQMRQRDANLTALAAIGPRKKRKVDLPGAPSGTEVRDRTLTRVCSSRSSSGVRVRSSVMWRAMSY